MELVIEPGKYVVAVSGGIDSMVLLDVLAKHEDLELIIAHFDHGIRPDSAEDRKFVQSVAKEYGLKFEYQEGHLGEAASEEQARNARYAFLHSVSSTHHARGVITAHHQDDLIETSFLNMLRGTGRKGITSLSSGPHIYRPLLHIPKVQIRAYAAQHAIRWREDSTNNDTKYARNYIRSTLVPKLTSSQKEHLLDIITNLQSKNYEIDLEIAKILQLKSMDKKRLKKHTIIMMPHAVACESVAAWLRLNGIRDFDRNLIERTVVAIKTYKAGRKADLINGAYVLISHDYAEIKSVAKR